MPSPVAGLLGLDERAGFGPAPQPTVVRTRRQRRRRRRLVRTVAVVALAAVLVALVVDDVSVRDRLGEARLTLAQARQMHRQTLATTGQARAALDRTDVQARALGWTVQAGSDVYGVTTQHLSAARQALAIEGLSQTLLRECLGGVQTTFLALAGGNQAAAVGAVDSVAGACLALDGGQGGPVYPFDLADPSVLVAGNRYYAYGTNAEAGAVQVIQSSDLVHWTAVGNALPALPSWAVPGHTWAPSVLHRGGQYVLYYAVSSKAAGVDCVSEATSTSPTGPFVDTSTAPLVCQTDLAGSIDPNSFVDASNGVWLDWTSNGAGGQPSTIWAQAMNNKGTALVGTPTALLTPTLPWEADRVEAPDMVTLGGQDLLFYSGNSWTTADYAVGVAVCAGPTGPCTKPAAQPLLATQSVMAGPGSPSVFTDLSGNLWIAFHAWLPSAVGYPHSRLLFLRKLTVVNGQPVVQPPS